MSIEVADARVVKFHLAGQGGGQYGYRPAAAPGGREPDSAVAAFEALTKKV